MIHTPNKESSFTFIILTVIAVSLMLLLLIGFISTQKNNIDTSIEDVPLGSKRDKSKGYDFYIYNYLTDHTIRIEIVEDNNDKAPYIIADGVESGERHGITKRQSLRAFDQGNLIKVYIRRKKYLDRPLGDWKLYTTLRINIDGIKALRIGMITSIWNAGDSNHSVQQAATGNVQGMPFIRIHNLSELPLDLNYNISIPPKDILHYRGEHALGIALGLILRDQNGMYPTTHIDKPITDLYFGVTSDVKLGLYSGLSYSPRNEKGGLMWDDPGVEASGIYLLEDGWY